MALDKITLNSDILAILNTLACSQSDPIQARIDFANSLSNAIEKYVKSGTVSGSVTVDSVSGVTVGAGISGAGTGTFNDGTIA